MQKDPSATDKAVINPKELIEELSIEAFNHYSDLYYKKLPLPEYQMAKPFSMVAETAEHLRLIGTLLQGLKMIPGLRTLDFGAGTCWLSKMIWQMGCPTISLDVSQEALNLGKRLFEENPVPLDPKVEYDFLLFDGCKIELPDSSIDRIICYDVFHHVPNQEEVMKEFYRILAPGGMIGFNEPLGEHSKSAESQYEMRTYKVLENDLHMTELADLAKSVGFGDLRFKVFALPEFEIDESVRQEICNGVPLNDWLVDSIRDSMRTSGVFFFSKGLSEKDSRSADGLAHELKIHSGPIRFPANTHAYVDVTVTNMGTSKWLHGGGAKIGTVNVGTQLFDTDKHIISVDLTRGNLPQEVMPGESVSVKVPLVLKTPGHYKVGFDLVSELVTWFHMQGSKMAFLDIEVY